MKSVFVVTEGCYSDYTIEAVFSTRKLADMYVQRHQMVSRWTQDWRVEEWPLDAWNKREVPRTVWSVCIDLKSGKITDRDSQTVLALPRARIPMNLRVTAEVLSNPPRDMKGGRHICVGSLVSVAHAEKLAAEARQKWLRMKTSGNDARKGG